MKPRFRTGDEGSSWVLRRLFGLWVALQILAVMSPADGEERFRAGTKDVTLAAGYSISHNTTKIKDLEEVDGFHLIPHFGYFLTDEQGTGWLRGNFELLAEPTAIHLSDSSSQTVAGLTLVGRWVFATGSMARPYLEAGVGVLGGKVSFRQTNCDVNFILQTGPGVLVFLSETTALTVGYRFHHISNSGICSKNQGLNSSLFILGVSYFFS